MRSSRATEGRARPYSCFVLERRNSAIMLPKLYVVPLDELLGIFHRGLIVGAHKSNCSADKTVFVHDVSSILDHIGVTPNRCGPHQARAVCPVPDSETLMFGLAEAKAFIVLRRAKKVRPRISPRPDPIGTGYIRPNSIRFQFSCQSSLLSNVQLDALADRQQHARKR
jgi:hypothetical protein